MSSFTDPLDVRRLHGPGDRWETLRDIRYWTDCADTVDALEVRCITCYTVPAGFVTDFASIPRVFWTFIGHPAGRYAQAAALHDWRHQLGTTETLMYVASRSDPERAQLASYLCRCDEIGAIEYPYRVAHTMALRVTEWL